MKRRVKRKKEMEMRKMERGRRQRIKSEDRE
jgi:hypothetical protein